MRKNKKSLFAQLIVIFLISVLPFQVGNQILNNWLYDNVQQNAVAYASARILDARTELEDAVEVIRDQLQFVLQNSNVRDFFVFSGTLTNTERYEMMKSIKGLLHYLHSINPYLAEIHLCYPETGMQENGGCNMDNEKELVRFILQYLLDNHFESKSDMARQLDIRHRTMQRVFEQLHNDKAKGSTIVLERALLFCAKRKISVDRLFREYQDFHQGGVLEPVQHDEDAEAMLPARELCLPVIESPSEEVKKYYEYYLRVLSMFFCRRCPNCCNPWDNLDWMQGDCTMAMVSQNLLDTVSKSKTEAE